MDEAASITMAVVESLLNTDGCQFSFVKFNDNISPELQYINHQKH